MFVVSVPSLRLQYSSYLLVVFMCLGGVPQAVQLVLISRAAFIVFTGVPCSVKGIAAVFLGSAQSSKSAAVSGILR